MANDNRHLKKALVYGTAGLVATASALGVMLYSPVALNNASANSVATTLLSRLHSSKRRAGHHIKTETGADVFNQVMRKSGLNDATTYSQLKASTRKISYMINHYPGSTPGAYTPSELGNNFDGSHHDIKWEYDHSGSHEESFSTYFKNAVIHGLTNDNGDPNSGLCADRASNYNYQQKIKAASKNGKSPSMVNMKGQPITSAPRSVKEQDLNIQKYLDTGHGKWGQKHQIPTPKGSGGVHVTTKYIYDKSSPEVPYLSKSFGNYWSGSPKHTYNGRYVSGRTDWAGYNTKTSGLGLTENEAHRGHGFDTFIGYYHTQLAQGQLESKNGMENKVMIASLPGSNGSGKSIKIAYPDSIQYYAHDKNGNQIRKRGSVVLTINHIHYYSPWRDNEHRSIIFSRNIAKGFRFNGIHSAQIYYDFRDGKTGKPLSLKEAELQINHLDGVRKYTDPDPHSGTYLDNVWTNNEWLDKNMENHNKFETDDPTGQFVMSNPAGQQGHMDEWSNGKSSKIRKYYSYALRGYAIGGQYDSYYHGKGRHFGDDHAVTFKMPQGAHQAEFTAGSGEGYGLFRPSSNITFPPVKQQQQTCKKDCTPPPYRPPHVPPVPKPNPQKYVYTTGSDGIHVTNTKNGTTDEIGQLAHPNQEFAYGADGSIPERTLRNNKTSHTETVGSGKNATSTTYYDYTDQHPNDYFKFRDPLPKDVTYKGGKVKFSDGTEEPLKSYGNNVVGFDLSAKDMAKLTGSATTELTHTTDGNATDPATHNASYHLKINVEANKLPKPNDGGNESDDSEKNPWQGTGYHQMQNYNDEQDQGWYRFQNGGSTGPNATYAKWQNQGKTTQNHYSNKIIIEIKRIRASIWHYDYDYGDDSGEGDLHEDDNNQNFFPDAEQAYGLQKGGGSTDPNWISPKGLGYSKRANEYRKEHENPKSPANSANGEKFPYRYNKYFYGYTNSLKHYYHYGYEGDYYKAPIVDRYKDKNRTEHFRLVYPHHKDSGWTSDSGKGANAFDSQTGKKGGYVIIPMHSNVGGHQLDSYSTKYDTHGDKITTETDNQGFRQTNYLPYEVPRIDLWPKDKFGNKAGRVIIDTDHACHGLPFRLDMRPINYLYGSNKFGDGYQGEFGNAKVQLTVTTGNNNQGHGGSVLYQETRKLAGNQPGALISEKGGYQHNSQLDEWPKGSNGWKGYIQQSAINKGMSSDYDLNTKKILNCGYHGKLPLHFNIKVINNDGQAQVDPVNINTYAYLTAGHRIQAKDFGHKITYGQGADENGHGSDLNKSENNQPDGSDKPAVTDIRPNRATIVAPERTLHYGTNLDDPSSARELNEKISVSQPRNAVAKTGYGMSANDLGIHYAGHLMAKPYAHSGTNMDYAFPSAFNSKDSDIHYNNDARHKTLKAHGKKDQALMDQLIHVKPQYKTTDGDGTQANGMGENQDLNPHDSQELDTADSGDDPDYSDYKDADAQFDSKFHEGLYAGRFDTTYGFYPRAALHNQQNGTNRPNTYNGNVLLGKFANTNDDRNSKATTSTESLRGSQDDPLMYNDPKADSSYNYSFNTKNGSGNTKNEAHHISGFHPFRNTFDNTNDDKAEQIGTDGQNERMFTPKFMKLGTYQTAFERPYTSHGKGSRAHRLGTNFFDIDEKRPVHFYAHEFISKNEKKSQPYDELSLQPILTNPKNGLSQTPQSSPEFPSNWLSNGLWDNSNPID